MIYKTIVYYKSFQGKKQEGKNKNIEKALQYLIHSLKLYDKEIFEIGEKKEKRIVRTIKIFYREFVNNKNGYADLKCDDYKSEFSGMPDHAKLVATVFI